MGLNDEIKYYTEKLNIKIAKNKNEQIKNLIEKLGKAISKGYSDRNYHYIFTSQELRTLLIKLEKVHKAMNKYVSYIEFEKRINKIAKKTKGETKEETQNLHWNIYKEQIRLEQEMMLALFNIQWAVSKLNLLCGVLSVYEYVDEKDRQNREKEDAEILTHSIFEALIEGSNL